MEVTGDAESPATRESPATSLSRKHYVVAQGGGGAPISSSGPKGQDMFTASVVGGGGANGAGNTSLGSGAHGDRKVSRVQRGKFLQTQSYLCLNAILI